MPQWRLNKMVENGGKQLVVTAYCYPKHAELQNHKLASHLQASLEFAAVSKVDLSDGHLEQTASAISACQSKEAKQDLEKMCVCIYNCINIYIYGRV